MPAACSASSSKRPAGPMKGSPARSSSLPGCSPTSTTRACFGPLPNTVCVALRYRSQPRHRFAARSSVASVLRSGKKSRALRSGGGEGNPADGFLAMRAYRGAAHARSSGGAQVAFLDEKLTKNDFSRCKLRTVRATRPSHFQSTQGVKQMAKAKKAAAKKSGGGGKKLRGGISTPVTLSAQLADIVGGSTMTRADLTKKIWAYIKKNGLQDQKNRRNINADAKLKPIFGGKGTVSMFEMTKLVNKHVK